MISLPNGCYCSGVPADIKKGTPNTLTVYPRNWNKSKAPLSTTWYISYRFYDPRICKAGTKKPKPKLVIFKGHINSFTTLHARQVAVNESMRQVFIQLIDEGYNPIKNTYCAPIPLTDIEVVPECQFFKALEKAVVLLICTKETRDGAKWVVAGLKSALEELRYAEMPVGEVEPKHLTILFTYVKKRDGDSFTNAKWNRYRAHLVMLFKRLKKVGAIKSNYAEDIDRLKKVRKIRETLSKQQAVLVNEYLQTKSLSFHRLMHIFYHSGGRGTELVELKGRNVDLKAQTYKCTIMKGAEPFEVMRTIKDIALPYWREAMDGCGKDDYVFSKGLKPGPFKISPTQFGRRWNRWVKKKLNAEIKTKRLPVEPITADWYALKHLNTTHTINWLMEVEKQKLEQARRVVASQNAHKGTTMVEKTYDTESGNREHEGQKKIGNTLG